MKIISSSEVKIVGLKFGIPGDPKSPSPKGVSETIQLEPTLLSKSVSNNAIDAPVGSGKDEPLSHPTLSIILP